MEHGGAGGGPSPGKIFVSFLRLGLTAFGGPAMIPYIRELVVDKRGWVTEEDFRNGMSLSQTIPGATAMQVAAYAGFRARSVWGALAAYLGFGLPAFALITVLSYLYVRHQDVGLVLSVFAGLKVVVVALIAHAALNFVLQYVKRPLDAFLAVLAGVWLGFKLNPILIIVSICLASTLLYRSVHTQAEQCTAQACGRRNTLGHVGAFLLVLAGGLVVLRAVRPELFDLGVLMAKVDCFAFGGGYVSIPLMLHEIVDNRSWMDAATFMDGIALGQVTPGPIVMTSAFVGYYISGLWGAAVGTVYVFAPSFLLVIAGVPFMDRLLGSELFRRALHGSLVTLVGLMAAVALLFGMAVHWTWSSAILCSAAFVGLRLGVDVLWIVLGGGLVSLFVL